MIRLDQHTVNTVQVNLERVKIFNIGDLASALKCSIPTARLKLRQWQAYTSYNQNGRFYTLPQVPSFDRHGLWRHKDVAFSKYGNLKKTIIHLVTSSPSGLSGRQLGALIGLSPQSFLHHFRDCPGIFREKHKNIFIYFADDSEINEKQARQRCEAVRRSTLAAITDPEAIVILVAIIKHQGISAEDISALPEIKKSKISRAAIQSFMEYHGLIKKNPALKP